MSIPTKNYAFVRNKLLNKEEIAFLDVREEDPHAQEHPLFAANVPLSRIEIDAYSKLPRKNVPIVTLDDGEGDAELAAQRLMSLGYSDVSTFEGGVQGWKRSGGELFRDVNVPSKSFGELVESKRHTPSLSAQEVKKLLDDQEDVVVVDVRRFDEYHTMSIPTAISCPGAELVLRIAELAPRPETRVIVNCAGRTRSIIGTQSLVNAGIPNQVAALRNGTIGWTLAGQKLDRGQTRKFTDVSASTIDSAAARARKVADRAGVKRTAVTELDTWRMQVGRTTYFFDTRTPEEFAAGHLLGFRSTPGGQLVQETEMVAPVRGARIVLADNDGVRANMTASWLAQMAWDVCVLDGLERAYYSDRGEWAAPLPPTPSVKFIPADELALLQKSGTVVVLDLGKHAQYVKGHIPGALYVLRSQFRKALSAIPRATQYVLTCADGVQSSYAAAEIARALGAEVSALKGGTRAWAAAGHTLEQGATQLLSEPIDRYKRPYEGTDNAHVAMQAYLDWEFGLVEQLGRDGTHHFWVLKSA